MFGFPWRKTHLALELTASEIKVAALSGRGRDLDLLATHVEQLPANASIESFSTPNIADTGQYSEALRKALASSAHFRCKRAAVSLPDALFRTQVLEFDALPKGHADRERLIRWRFEKTAAFDLAGTDLRYQVLERRGQRVLLICSFGRREVIGQYEDVLRRLGLEVWHIGPASLHALNLYGPSLVGESGGFALAYVARSSLATIIWDRGAVRFYRHKELRTGSTGEMRDRLARELDDSLHFYAHQDREQKADIGRLLLTGEPELCGPLAAALQDMPDLSVVVLVPGDAVTIDIERHRPRRLPENMDAVLGAGVML